MRISIDELVLSIPGLDPSDARILGQKVAERVGERLADNPFLRADAGALDLRLTLPRGTPVAALVDPIVDAILLRLR